MIATTTIERQSLVRARQWAYRCEVTNYSEDVLVDVTFDVGLTLVRPERVPDQPNAFKQGEVTLYRRWRVAVAKIDAGPRDPFIFYVHNCCLDRFVHVKMPEKGTARAGEQTVELEIQQSASNVLQPLNPTSMFAKQ